jgi:pyruvate formate lyase activating enzyme
MMQFYQPTKQDKVRCLLCGHYCNIKVGEVGVCKVNKNIGEKIECLVYGYPNAMNIDPVEKKPLYHFLPKTKTFSIGTVGCNFHCSFCQNWQLSQTDNINKERYYSPEDIVKLALYYECKSISYTYNEPTIFFPYIQDIAKLAHKYGLKNIMVSNGFESKEVSESMVGLIDAVNVDLKSFDEKYYKTKLGGKLEVILENLKYYVKNGIHTEITTLIVPTQNDTPEELEKIASFISNELCSDVVWHISAFHPDYKDTHLPNTPISILTQAKEIGYRQGLKNIYLGNVNIY